MQQIADWLEKLGMFEYAELFAKNRIDFSVLPDLTDQDLEKLGVKLGDRRKMLRTIATLKGVDASIAVGTAAPAAPRPLDSAERRQVTVMFSDMVGSTALSTRMDPEDLREVISAYQKCVAETVQRFGGFVAKYMGDGVLVYFGYPEAHEDDAERAVRAGLELVAAVNGLKTHAALQTRLGISTGLVVVGEIVGIGTAQERAIVGETPNLASRLQTLAAPDTILIGEATKKLLGGLFELEPTGEHELKGFARLIPAWRVRGEAIVESRFAAIRAGRQLPLIGRAHEIELMRDRLRLTPLGGGQVVTVIGEAGIGKSRLIEALQEAHSGELHSRIHLQCSPYHGDSALYPVIQHLARAARFTSADLPNARIEKLRAVFAQRASADATAIPLLAELLSIPGEEPAPPLALTPARRKEATLALLVDEIVRLGQTDPVLLVLEDAQWIDATTLELMTRLTDSIGSARLLAVVTARPEFVPPWQARPHSTLLTLGRLGRAECAELVVGVAASHGLPAETIAAIVAKTDGVPLFAEELTKGVMESASGDSAAVPATLKDSLMARLDRLGEAREVAQIASVIGRQFTLALLDAVAATGRRALEAALEKLGAAGIVFPEGHGLERSFTFKHVLVRDAAYESLLLGRRREWHERIAHAIEERFPELAANGPELLAHHFGEAGLAGPACDYRMRAGDRAVSRSAYNEAIAHYSVGAKSAEALLEPTERMCRQLEFLLKLGPALMLVRGPHSIEVEDAYRRAGEIGEAVGDAKATYKAKWGLWYNANLRAKTALTRERAYELITLAERSGDSELLIEAYHVRFSTAFLGGEVAAMVRDGRIGVQSYDVNRHHHLGEMFGGHDPGVCAHLVIGMGLQMSGDPRQANESMAQAFALAEALDDPNSVVHALNTSGMFQQFVGDREATLVTAHRLAALVEKFELVAHRAHALLLSTWADAAGSGVAEAARLFETEIEKATVVGPLPRYYLGLAGEVMLAAGRPSDGLAHLDRAIAMLDEPNVGLYLPEIHRLRGECLLALSRSNKTSARQAFVTARDVARLQGATLFERRAEARLAEIAN